MVVFYAPHCLLVVIPSHSLGIIFLYAGTELQHACPLITVSEKAESM